MWSKASKLFLPGILLICSAMLSKTIEEKHRAFETWRGEEGVRNSGISWTEIFYLNRKLLSQESADSDTFAGVNLI